MLLVVVVVKNPEKGVVTPLGGCWYWGLFSLLGQYKALSRCRHGAGCWQAVPRRCCWRAQEGGSPLLVL